MTIRSQICWEWLRKPLRYLTTIDNSSCFRPTPLSRADMRKNSFEPYLQDIWKVSPHLTLTLASATHSSLLSGKPMVCRFVPAPDLGQWFSGRAREGAGGIPSSQRSLLQIDWCGPANGKKGIGTGITATLVPASPLPGRQIKPKVSCASFWEQQ